ncbi:MAG TPA: hypothetical protein VF189_03735 [Patescibacteria group bacterium]
MESPSMAILYTSFLAITGGVYVVKINGVGEGVRVGMIVSCFTGELLRKKAPSSTRAKIKITIRSICPFILLSLWYVAAGVATVFTTSYKCMLMIRKYIIYLTRGKEKYFLRDIINPNWEDKGGRI